MAEGARLGSFFYAVGLDDATIKKQFDDLDRLAQQRAASVSKTLEGAGVGAAKAGQSVDRGLTQPIKRAEAQAQSAKSTFDQVFAGFTAANLATKAIGEVTSAMQAGAKSAVDFTQKMADLRAVSGATAAQMDQLAKSAATAGTAFGVGADESASGLVELTKAGLSAQEALDSLAATTALAKAGGTDLAKAAAIETAAMNAFGISAGGAARIADTLAGAANASQSDVEGMGLALSQSAAVAAAAGVSFDDTATALTVLAKNGLQASDSGTSLKVFLQNLVPTSAQAEKAFKDLGLITADGSNKFFDAAGNVKSLAEVSEILNHALAGITKQQQLATLQVAFGTDAMRAAVLLAKDGAKGFNDVADSMQRVAAIDLAKLRTDSLAGDLDKAAAASERLAVATEKTVDQLSRTATGGLSDALNALATAQERTNEIRDLNKQNMELAKGAPYPDYLQAQLANVTPISQYGGSDADFQKKLQEQFPLAYSARQRQRDDDAQTALEDARSASASKGNKSTAAGNAQANVEQQKKDLADSLAAAKDQSEARRDAVKAGLDAENQAYQDNSKLAIREADAARDGALGAAQERRDSIIKGLDDEHEAAEKQRTAEDRATRDQQQQEDRALAARRTAQDQATRAQYEAEDRARAASQAAILKGLDEEKAAIERNTKASKAAIDQHRDDTLRAIDAESQAEQHRHEAASRALDDQTKAEARRHDQAKRNLEDEEKLALKPFEDQLKALDASKQAADDQKTDREQQKALGDAQSQLGRAQLAGDPTGILKAQQDLAAAQAAISDTSAERQREKDRQAAQDQIDAIKTDYDGRKQAEDDLNQANTDRIAAAKQAEDDLTAHTKEQIDQRGKDAKDAADAEQAALDASTQAALDSLQTRLDAVKQAADAENQAVADARQLYADQLAASRQAEDQALADFRQHQADALSDQRRSEDEAYAHHKQQAQDTYDSEKKLIDSTHDQAVQAAKDEADSAEREFARRKKAADDTYKAEQDWIETIKTKITDLNTQLKYAHDLVNSLPEPPGSGGRTRTDAGLGAGGAAPSRPAPAPSPTPGPAADPPAVAPQAPTDLNDLQAAYDRAHAGLVAAQRNYQQTHDTLATLQAAQAKGQAINPYELAEAKTFASVATTALQAAQAAEASALQALAAAQHGPQTNPLPATRTGPARAQARADGGPVLPGHWYIVGEHGPEPFMPSAPGYIYPHESPVARSIFDRIGHPSFSPGSGDSAATRNNLAASQPSRLLLTPELIAAAGAHPSYDVQQQLRRRGLLDSNPRLHDSLTADTLFASDERVRQLGLAAAQRAADQRNAAATASVAAPTAASAVSSAATVSAAAHPAASSGYLGGQSFGLVRNDAEAARIAAMAGPAPIAVHNMLVPQPPALPQYQYPGEGPAPRGGRSNTFHAPFMHIDHVGSDVDMDRAVDRALQKLDETWDDVDAGGSRPTVIQVGR